MQNIGVTWEDLIVELSPNKEMLTLVGDDKESRIKTFSVITFK